jgi:dimethylhistidine N-methyltransferase
MDEAVIPDTMLGTLNDFGRAVVLGLSQAHKSIPARYFYDRRGSELFEAITELPEYYPTRTEIALLKTHAADIARLAGSTGTLVEFGAGSATKTPIVLEALHPSAYLAIDISGDFLDDSLARLARDHPQTTIIPVTGDFTHPLTLPDVEEPMTGFFPGSTIGNFGHFEAVDLLRAMASTLGEGSRLLIGLDTRKNPRLLEAAYDDAAGITAAFNLNLLHRINRELDGTIPVEAFEHRAWWHDGHGRMEMHLLATRDLAFEAAGHRFTMREGETIHTENSYKYSLEESRLLARAAGWEPMASWTDTNGLFSFHVWAHEAKGIGP